MQIVAFFVPLLEDKRPLVQSITCWTLSRYSKWIVQVNGIPFLSWLLVGISCLRLTVSETVFGSVVIGVRAHNVF